MKAIYRQWILERMCYYPAPLDWLLPNLAVALNALEIPGFTGKDYADLISWAISDGLIFLTCGQQIISTADSGRVLSAFLSGRGDRCHNLVLTEAGGRIWEQMAAPRWPSLVDISDMQPVAGNHELQEGLVVSQDRTLVMAVLGWYRELRGTSIMWESVVWSHHLEYPVLYWKTLPNVYEAKFSSTWNELPNEPSFPWLRTWEVSLAQWYTHCWERPEWAEQRT